MKINKIVATRCHIVKQKMRHIRFRQRSPDTLAGILGTTFKGKEGGRTGGKGEGGKKRGDETYF